MLSRKWMPTLFQTKRKGIFGGPLVIQTLAAHFAATFGTEIVPILGNPN